MRAPAKTSFYVVLSAVLSIVLHLVLLGVARHLEIDLFAAKEGEVEERRLHVSAINLRERVLERKQRPLDDIQEAREQLLETIRNTDKIRNIFEEENLVEKAKPKLKLDGLGADLLKPKAPSQAPPRQASAPRPEIMEIDAQNLPANRLAMERNLRPKVARQNVATKNLPSLVNVGDLQGASGQTFSTSMRLSRPASSPLKVGELPENLLTRQQDGADGDGGQRTQNPLAPAPGLPGGATTSRYTTPDGVNVSELDALLSVRMSVYEEPENGGFFRLDISPNPRSDRLQAVPMDILFLIDVSTSISASKLAQFKEGVEHTLQYLNRNDRFNIVSFRDRPSQLFQQFVPVNDTYLAQATEFVRKIQRGGMTDIFAGLAPFVQMEETERPLNIFLMSDGETTVKDSPQNEELIQKIVSLNKANVSIYSFSAGQNVNLFLMDFLAYHNRGMSMHEERLSNFTAELVEFISSHSEVIVADLKYHITNGLTDEIYPKRLPHLYRGETLSIYGRYPSDAQEIAVSIVGRNAAGNLEELIYRANIDECPRETSRLALDWAAQKVFHLIGLRTLRPSRELNTQIRELAKLYNLYVPY